MRPTPEGVGNMHLRPTAHHAGEASMRPTPEGVGNVDGEGQHADRSMALQ